MARESRNPHLYLLREINMIKGWRNNPQWVKYYEEKAAQKSHRKTMRTVERVKADRVKAELEELRKDSRGRLVAICTSLPR
jgi:hypothetical protein